MRSHCFLRRVQHVEWQSVVYEVCVHPWQRTARPHLLCKDYRGANHGTNHHRANCHRRYLQSNRWPHQLGSNCIAGQLGPDRGANSVTDLVPDPWANSDAVPTETFVQ